jgi:hypothetical protein
MKSLILFFVCLFVGAPNLFAKESPDKNLQMIRELQYEIDNPSENVSEAEAGRFEDLVESVAGLQDPRALPVLIRVIQTGNIVGDAIADFGDISVQPLLGLLNQSDLRFDSFFTLNKMLEPARVGHLSVSSLDSIRHAFEKGVTDPEQAVRQQAEIGLLMLDDPRHVIIPGMCYKLQNKGWTPAKIQ